MQTHQSRDRQIQRESERRDAPRHEPRRALQHRLAPSTYGVAPQIRAGLADHGVFDRVLGPVQAKGAAQGNDVHAIAAEGVKGSGSTLPHLGAIQKSFGKHDVSSVAAHVGGPAKAAAEGIGALAYASGNDVAFAQSPDLHTAAHEAAHVIQQRAGVSLKGGVGQAGDAYEQHADAVADLVASGKSAESLLDKYAGGGAGRSVQRKVPDREPGDSGVPGETRTTPSPETDPVLGALAAADIEAGAECHPRDYDAGVLGAIKQVELDLFAGGTGVFAQRVDSLDLLAADLTSKEPDTALDGFLDVVGFAVGLVSGSVGKFFEETAKAALAKRLGSRAKAAALAVHIKSFASALVTSVATAGQAQINALADPSVWGSSYPDYVHTFIKTQLDVITAQSDALKAAWAVFSTSVPCSPESRPAVAQVKAVIQDLAASGPAQYARSLAGWSAIMARALDQPAFGRVDLPIVGLPAPGGPLLSCGEMSLDNLPPAVRAQLRRTGTGSGAVSVAGLKSHGVTANLSLELSYFPTPGGAEGIRTVRVPLGPANPPGEWAPTPLNLAVLQSFRTRHGMPMWNEAGTTWTLEGEAPAALAAFVAKELQSLESACLAMPLGKFK